MQQHIKHWLSATCISISRDISASEKNWNISEELQPKVYSFKDVSRSLLRKVSTNEHVQHMSNMKKNEHGYYEVESTYYVVWIKKKKGAFSKWLRLTQKRNHHYENI